MQIETWKLLPMQYKLQCLKINSAEKARDEYVIIGKIMLIKYFSYMWTKKSLTAISFGTSKSKYMQYKWQIL